MAGVKRQLQSPGEMSRVKSQRLEKKKITAQYIGPVDKKFQEDIFIKKFCEKFKQPLDAIGWILSNAKMSVDEFIQTVWEKTHLVMPAADNGNDDLEKLFSLSFLEKILEMLSKEKRAKGLSNYQVDLRIAKFSEDKYIEVDQASDSSSKPPTLSQIKGYLDDGYTIQVAEPQAVHPALHALIEPLETFFGSLVSANGYVSPANCQMRAPRYDNEDYFVLQTVGNQKWELYKAMVELATDFSKSLDQKDIGEAMAVVTLKPGDVLYLPRGTIAQTVAGSEGQSAYIILSTYYKHHIGSFVLKTIPGVLRRTYDQSIHLRRAFLPPGLITPRNGTDSAMRAAYADAVVKLAEAVRSAGKLQADEVQPAMDSFVGQFMCSRMPPYKVEPYSLSLAISSDSKVRLRYKHHLAYYLRKSGTYAVDEEGEPVDVVCGESSDQTTADENLTDENVGQCRAGKETSIAEGKVEGDGYEVAVFCSIHNDLRSRSDCLSPEIGDNMVSFHGSYKVLLDKLMEVREPVAISDLEKEVGAKGDAVLLVQALSNMGAIEVVEGSC